MNAHENRLVGIKTVAFLLEMKEQTIRNGLSKRSFPLLPVKICGSLRWPLDEVYKFINSLKPVKH